MKKTISIIGSTGSVGTSAVEVLSNNRDMFQIEFLVAKSNYKKLIEQALELMPQYICIEDSDNLEEIKSGLMGTNIQIISGRNNILNLVKNSKSDCLVLSSSGTNAIEYFDSAISNIPTIAIANKESIVCAWPILQDKIRQSATKIIPIDSEHNAIFQILNNNLSKDVQSIIITASGGPFVDFKPHELKNVTLEQALKHPTWSMGNKISIDSATLMNKALEFIEASYLFNLKHDQIEVVVHRQSILHGGINFKDGTFIGNFYHPSMKVPIAYALNYPNRINIQSKEISLTQIGNLQFEKVNSDSFIAIDLAIGVLKKGGSYPCILNIANEIAVSYFMEKKISFISILDMVKYSLDTFHNSCIGTIDDIVLLYNDMKYNLSNNINKFTKD